MPMIAAPDGTRLHVRVEGRANAPALLFAHSVGCDLTLWDNQVAALAERFRILRYDARGHGRSDAPEGDYRIEQLAGDALAILDAFAIDRVHLCGLSLGGTLGQWLGIHAPERLASLTLCDTAARLGTAEGWQQRIDVARDQGMAALVDMSMTRFFSDGFRARAPETVAKFRSIFLTTPSHGFAGCCAVLRDCDFRDQLGRIAVPTLVLTGREDIPTPPADSEYLAAGIQGANLSLLDTGHISAVEAPEAFTAALAGHIGLVG
ncbi:3-oxoadipate enol-lactonase [Flavisphingomonas formosensis]|uniref:3-oxoadipate enol-lactonase n=1 Tax=Flavisphingomonas formosensis TaxID=861534 RepID=UPI0018DF57A3|nr:3-oxoadipate enol-lactonase [Sphingomonas formosensis]